MMASTWIAAGNRGQIVRSVDNGASWVSVGPGDVQQPGLPPGYWPIFRSEIANDGQSVWMLATEYTGIWRSADDGLTWALVPGTYTNDENTTQRWHWITYAGNNTFIAIERNDNAHFYVSTDSGQTFNAVAHNLGWYNDLVLNQITADPATGIVWAITNYRFIGARSADRGATWEIVNPDPFNYIEQLNLSFVNGLFIGANNGSIYWSPTAAEGTWNLVIVTFPYAGNIGKFAHDGTSYWGFDAYGYGHIRSTSLSTTWDYLPPDGLGYDPSSVASDGAGVVLYAGWQHNDWRNSSYPFSGLYRANADMTLTTLPTPVETPEDWHTIGCRPDPQPPVQIPRSRAWIL